MLSGALASKRTTYTHKYCSILSRILVTEMGFGLVFGFINRLQLATTNNYNTVPDLRTLKSLQYNLLSLFPLVFTIRFLATDLNTKTIRVLLNHTLQMLLHYSTHKVFTSHFKSSQDDCSQLANHELPASVSHRELTDPELASVSPINP
jgi:hypothetical protein